MPALVLPDLAAAAPAHRPARATGGTAVVMPMQRGASFGDLLVQAPFLKGLKDSLGAARVVVVAPHPAAELFSRLGLADAVAVLPDQDHAALRKLLDREAPRLAITLRGSSLRSSLLIRGCSGALRIGWSGIANRLLLDVTAPRRRDTYYPLVFGRLLHAVGGTVDPVATMAAIAEPHADDRLPVGERRLICLPAGKVAAKQWGVDNYLALAERLAANVPGLRPLVVLGPREEAYGSQFAAAGWEVRTGDAAGPRRLAALCAAAALVVANDCGPGHIAQMSGAPVVMLFPNHHGSRRRAELLKLWWWRRARSRALTTLQQRPLPDLPVAVVAEQCLAVLGDSSARSEALWWTG